MNYYLDTEFIEGQQSLRLFGIPTKSLPTIDLISIGIVSQDGREYYAVSKDFNLKEAWNRNQKRDHGTAYNSYGEKLQVKEFWIRENVLKPIWREFVAKETLDIVNTVLSNGAAVADVNMDFNRKTFEKLLLKHGKSNQEIAKEINDFCSGPNVQFYSYFGSYDWVAFCWLFGKMINLPKHLPRYCRDLKQILDDKAEALAMRIAYESGNHTVWTNERCLADLKSHRDYPKKTNDHIAISDAKWNKELHKFLETN